MPYVPQELRDLVDAPVDAILTTLTALPERKAKSVTEYILCRLVLAGMFHEGTESFSTMNDWIGLLHSAAHELRRQYLDPYEDDKLDLNGDLPVGLSFARPAPMENGYICSVCAQRAGCTWPKGHRATSHNGVCPVCHNQAGLCNVGDWNWPDGVRRGLRD